MTPTSTLPSGGVPFPQPTRQDFVGLRPWRRVCDRAKSPHTAIYDRARDVREIRSPDVSRQTGQCGAFKPSDAGRRPGSSEDSNLESPVAPLLVALYLE